MTPSLLIEFPAEDAARAGRFWETLLGLELEPRDAPEGGGWRAEHPDVTLGVHERGTGPGDRFALPYFAVPNQRPRACSRSRAGHRR